MDRRIDTIFLLCLGSAVEATQFHQCYGHGEHRYCRFFFTFIGLHNLQICGLQELIINPFQVSSWLTYGLKTVKFWWYNSVQMFEPFQDWTPHLFGTVSLSWFVIKSIFKTYSFNLFWTKPLRRKKILGKIWIFAKVIFNFSAEIGFFRLTWRVTLL